MRTDDAGRPFDEIGMAQQFIDAVVVQMAVVEIVLFRQPLRPARFENLVIDGPPHNRHLSLRDQRERPRPALLMVQPDLVFRECVLVCGHGIPFAAERAAG